MACIVARKRRRYENVSLALFGVNAPIESGGVERQAVKKPSNFCLQYVNADKNTIRVVQNVSSKKVCFNIKFYKKKSLRRAKLAQFSSIGIWRAARARSLHSRTHIVELLACHIAAHLNECALDQLVCINATPIEREIGDSRGADENELEEAALGVREESRLVERGNVRRAHAAK